MALQLTPPLSAARCLLSQLMLATESIAGWAVRAFGPPEIFALVVFGLTVAGAVGAKTVWKGWISVSLGLLIATVGVSPAGNVPRFNFGTTYLMGGVEFVAVILGVFAVSEVMKQGHKIATGLRIPPKIGIDFPRFAEFWALKLEDALLLGDDGQRVPAPLAARVLGTAGHALD